MYEIRNKYRDLMVKSQRMTLWDTEECTRG